MKVKKGFNLFPVPHHVRVGKMDKSDSRAEARWMTIILSKENDVSAYVHELTHVIQFWILFAITVVVGIFFLPFALALPLVIASFATFDVFYSVPFFRKHIEASAMAVQSWYWMYNDRITSELHYKQLLAEALAKNKSLYGLNITEDAAFASIMKWDKFFKRLGLGS